MKAIRVNHIYIIFILFLLLPSTSFSNIYRYIDADGRVHFTNTPIAKGYTLYLKEKRRHQFIYYRVKKGDSLYALATKYKISTSAIFNANPTISKSGKIYVDQILKIPKKIKIIPIDKKEEQIFSKTEPGFEKKYYKNSHGPTWSIDTQTQPTTRHESDLTTYQDFNINNAGTEVGNKQIIEISFILTLVIGLCPPLLIRFIILKRPLNSVLLGVGIVVFLWFLNVVVFNAMGSTSKTHAVYIFMGLVSFTILIIGPLKSTTKNEKSKTKERKSENFQQKKTKDQNDAKQGKNDKYFRTFFGLTEAHTIEDIKRRYKELVAQYHPDKVNHLGEEIKKTAENETKKINEAYEYFKQKYDL